MHDSVHALNDARPSHAAATLRVDYRHASLDVLLADRHLLAVFGFGDAAPASHDDPRYLHVALPALGNPPFECWSVAGDVQCGRDGGIAWSTDGLLQFGALEVADAGGIEGALGRVVVVAVEDPLDGADFAEGGARQHGGDRDHRELDAREAIDADAVVGHQAEQHEHRTRHEGEHVPPIAALRSPKAKRRMPIALEISPMRTRNSVPMWATNRPGSSEASTSRPSRFSGSWCNAVRRIRARISSRRWPITWPAIWGRTLSVGARQAAGLVLGALLSLTTAGVVIIVSGVVIAELLRGW